MMLLVALAHAAQNLNRFLDGWLFDMHGLEAPCEALDDRRLANAWLANQRLIVLAAARQYLNDALDLVLASDDGVEQTFRSLCGDIGAQLVDERRIVLLLAFALLARVGGRLAHLLQGKRTQFV